MSLEYYGIKGVSEKGVLGMDFNLDDNILWVLAILALVFFLFPQKNVSNVEEKAVEEEAEEPDYIYRRKCKERRRLVY